MDPLESEDFDVEDSINELFPDESSLENLPLLQVLIRQKILECNQTILDLRSELEKDSDGKTIGEIRVEGIQEGIGVLLTTLSTIRSSATESQSVVESITKEIRTLDLTKANIESAVVGLKRFGMLVNAFDQLTRVVKSRKYRETATAMQTVQQLSAQLIQLSTSVPRVASLFKSIQETQAELRGTIMDEFSAAFDGKSVSSSRTRLAESCLVIDTLGDDARNSLIDWYTNFQLREYRRIFSGASSEAGQLDNISRRYAWFRRILKTHEEDPTGGAQIFPESWEVGARLCGQFNEATREDLKSVLARSRSTLKIDFLLESLKTTTMFEREMSQKFRMPYDAIAAKSKSTQVGSATPIHTAFEPYLGIFVDTQDSKLSEMFTEFRSSRPKPNDFLNVSTEDRPASIIPSSTELFHFYRTTLDKCASLSNKSPFLDLCQVYKKWLKVYSEDVLAASLASVNGLGNYHNSSERGSVEYSLHNPSEISRLVRVPVILFTCAVLNTADYCAETSAQLQNKLQERIHADFRSKVSLESEEDLFRGNISVAISILVRELERSCEASFMSMARSPWKDVEYVSAESAHIHEIIGVVNGIVDLVKRHADQKKYVRSLCDKAVGSLVNKFSQAIVRCRPIPSLVAEQMVLDLQILKNNLLILPQLIEEESTIGSVYKRYVNKTLMKLERVLKVIMISEEPAEGFVKNYLILIPCQSFSDFQKALDLKGVKRSEQNSLLDVFLSITSVQTELEDTSFLSQLDMNPENKTGTNPTSSLLNFNNNNNNQQQQNQQVIGIGNLNENNQNLIGQNLMSNNDNNNNMGNNLNDLNSDLSRNKTLVDFKKFGQKLGMGLRFSRESKND